MTSRQTNPFDADYFLHRSSYRRFRTTAIAREATFEWYKGLIRHVERRWVGVYPLRSPAVEVGCGHGAVLEHLRERDLFAVGVEYSEWLAQEVHTLAPNAALVRGDGNALGLRSASAATVLAFEVIEHLPDPERALSEMLRILRPGGTAILTTPNPAGDVLPLYASRRDPTHVSIRSPASWSGSLRNVGFDDVVVDVVFQLPVVWRVRWIGSHTIRLPGVGPTSLILARKKGSR
jgi:SAM-dependent methyltransferase